LPTAIPPAAASPAAATTAAALTAGPPKDTLLTLRFTSDSWAEVYDANGQRLFYDVGGAASVHTVHGKPPLKVMLGNGPGVGVEVNGHHAAIDSTLRPDGSAHFTVNKDGRVLKRNGG
jgi:hypothetical protein